MTSSSQKPSSGSPTGDGPQSTGQNGGSQASGDSPSIPSSSHSPHADLAQALRDLARGEQAATALEANLTNLENKLDEMLAAFEQAAGPTAADGEADKNREIGDDKKGK